MVYCLTDLQYLSSLPLWLTKCVCVCMKILHNICCSCYVVVKYLYAGNMFASLISGNSLIAMGFLVQSLFKAIGLLLRLFWKYLLFVFVFVWINGCVFISLLLFKLLAYCLGNGFEIAQLVKSLIVV